MDFKVLDKYFNEVDEPNKDIFNTIISTEELHYIAENHNWDAGITVLEWILENKLCSESTALMIFWRAQPYDYLKYKLNQKPPKNDYVDIFNLIKTIMEKYKNGFYKKPSIKYNPKDDMPENENIPAIMLNETNGEEPYIYYDKKDAVSWFGEYMDILLAKCDNCMELYNITYILGIYSSHEFSKHYQKILEHKYCDKGIALFIYWKVNQHFPFVAEINEIENKIINNEYKEIIKYNPKEDKSNKINTKNKWEIPEIMKQEIK